jgi:hypothetical protein
MNVSPALSIVILGADVAIATTLLFGARRALLTSGKPPADVRRVISIFGSVLFAWLAATFILGRAGIFRSAVHQPFPYIAIAIFAPIITGALFIRHSKPVRELIDAVPQSWLVGVQVYRVVGVTFLVLHTADLLPSIFALPAGYGDVFIGISAMLVALAYAQNHSQSLQLVTLWNWFGIADLVIASGTGFLSAPSRFQVFAFEAPNTLIGSYPLVMIPIFAVPLSIVLHLASLSRLRQDYRRATPGIGAIPA